MRDLFGPLPVKRPRQVVVTGLGVICALGSGLDHVWQRLLAGQCGIAQLREADVPEVSVCHRSCSVGPRIAF